MLFEKITARTGKKIEALIHCLHLKKNKKKEAIWLLFSYCVLNKSFF